MELNDLEGTHAPPQVPRIALLAVGCLLLMIALGVGLWRFGGPWLWTAAIQPIDPAEGLVGAERQRRSAEALGLPVFSRNSLGMDFAWCPPGDFVMGTPQSDPLYRQLEHPHRVRLTQGFYLSRYEVTEEQFHRMMASGQDPVEATGLPVSNVTWNEALEFCVRLTRQEELNGYEYRLPTEAEWEYACRADTKTAWYYGTNANELSRYGWVKAGRESELQLGGQLLPNAWGLFDMYGNVWEWCHDHYDSYPLDELTIDPRVSQVGRDRVRRGGSVGRYANEATSSRRNALKPTQRDPQTGFRVVLAKVQTSIEDPPDEQGP